MDDAEIDRRLSDLGIELPPAPRPVAAYVPVRFAGDLAFVAGQVPMVDGRVLHAGRLGDPAFHLTPEEAKAAAGQAALQALSALREALGGSLDRLRTIAQVTVYLATSPDFVDHPAVANGASELLADVLGEAGSHARVAVGVASLPLGSCVEVAVTAHVD